MMLLLGAAIAAALDERVLVNVVVEVLVAEADAANVFHGVEVGTRARRLERPKS